MLRYELVGCDESHHFLFLFILLPNEKWPQNQEVRYSHGIGTANRARKLPP